MRYIFLIIVFIHAIIHLFGFIQAFDLGELEGLNMAIGRNGGLLWLSASMLLLVMGLLNILKVNWWWIIAIVSVILSQVLIVMYWADAKYGTVPNIIILLIACTYAGGYFFHNKIKKEKLALRSHFNTLNEIQWDDKSYESLPISIKKWLSHSGVKGRKPILGAHVKQEVSLKMKPDQKEWIKGRAKQIFTTSPPSFIWTVNLKMKLFFKIVGRDRFINGQGSMLIKLLSLISIVNVKDNPRINEAALQRYLSEMVLFPTAMLSDNISWSPVDDYSADATIEVNGTSGKGTFYFDEAYNFERFEAMRFKDVDESAERIPWIVSALDHKEINGIIVPVNYKVEWEIDGQKWKWLEMQISDIQYIDHIPEEVLK
ncbi:MAG: hypothetical protein HKN68_06625 [Saprospiraceae bacterium]|nr:hypothetical protein [Saprospiraceae bacterium]